MDQVIGPFPALLTEYWPTVVNAMVQTSPQLLSALEVTVILEREKKKNTPFPWLPPTKRLTWSHQPVQPLHGGRGHPGPGAARQRALGARIKGVLVVQHEQLAHALVADAVLTWQDERVGEELLADGADQLPLDVLDRHLSTGGRINK